MCNFIPKDFEGIDFRFCCVIYFICVVLLKKLRKEGLVMKRRITNTAAFLPLLALLLSLLIFPVSCEKEADTVKTGIEVEPGKAEQITEQTEKRAENIIGTLVSLYYEKSGKKISDERLSEMAGAIAELTVAESSSERAYSAFLDVLERIGQPLISSAVRLSKGKATNEDFDVIGNAYFEFTEESSTEFLGSVAYGLCIIAYDSKIEHQLNTGSAVGSVLAKELQRKKDIFENHIGKESFSELLRLAFFSRGFFTEGALDTAVAGKFSDKELLILIKRLDFSKLSIDSEGYKLIIEYYCGTLIGKETSYFDELLYKANHNGDVDKFAKSLTELPKLLSSITENMGADDISLMRKGDKKALAASIFAAFSEEDWLLFEKITDISVKSEIYEEVALSFFGEDFESHKTAIEEKSIDELKASIGKENFHDTLEGYIFGISPAFSYGFEYD